MSTPQTAKAERVAALEEALSSLVHEATAVLTLGEEAMRWSVGNTNIACLRNSISDARLLLSTPPETA